MVDSELQRVREVLLKLPISSIKDKDGVTCTSAKQYLIEYLNQKIQVGSVVRFIDDEDTCMLRYNLSSQAHTYTGHGVVVEISDGRYTFKMFDAVREEFTYVYYDMLTGVYYNPPKRMQTRSPAKTYTLPVILLDTSVAVHYSYFMSIRNVDETI